MNKRLSKPGFTLIEMMVVMGIIGIMLTLATVGIKDLNKGKGVPNAVDITGNLLREARAVAQAKGRARLVIVNDTSDRSNPSKHLRYVAVMSDADGDVETEDWELTGNGMELPNGVFFSPQWSQNSNSASSRGFCGETVTCRLGKDTKVRCNYVEFNSEGVMVWPPAGQKIVFVEGVLKPTDKEPNPGAKDEKGRPKTIGGLVLHRLGNFSLIRTPGQVYGK